VKVLSLPYGTTLLAQVAPMLLVAYITTMLSADIRRAYGHMKLLSETDELTGVLNMRAFMAVADRLFHQAERYARPFSVLMIDSDSLKTVNDNLGHEAGNRLLQLTVQCIQSQLRQTDLIARYGGKHNHFFLHPSSFCLPPLVRRPGRKYSASS
jgi:GGDEF domain-containing protein